jgi:hypothetical protein
MIRRFLKDLGDVAGTTILLMIAAVLMVIGLWPLWLALAAIKYLVS